MCPIGTLSIVNTKTKKKTKEKAFFFTSHLIVWDEKCPGRRTGVKKRRRNQHSPEIIIILGGGRPCLVKWQCAYLKFQRGKKFRIYPNMHEMEQNENRIIHFIEFLSHSLIGGLIKWLLLFLFFFSLPFSHSTKCVIYVLNKINKLLE